MDHLELLDLISKGETENLLIQKDLNRRLNILAAIGLIEICEGKLQVTSKGKLAQKKRDLRHLETVSVQKDLEEFSKSTFKRNSLYIYFCLVLLCTSAIYLISIIIKGY